MRKNTTFRFSSRTSNSIRKFSCSLMFIKNFEFINKIGFVFVLHIRLWISYLQETDIYVPFFSICLSAMVLLFEASSTNLLPIKMGGSMTIGQNKDLSELKSFKLAERILFKVSVRLKPLLYLGSVIKFFQ